MIYVLCLNPAVDCYEKYNRITLGNSNRTRIQKFSIGGKGINVAIMLNNLGVKSKLITVLGGYTGQFILNELKNKKIDVYPIFTSTTTRINLKVFSVEETAFDIIPRKNNYVIKKIKDYLKEIIKEEDILIVSGSGYGYYEILSNLKCKLVLDVSGNNLKELVKLKPYLVKPNIIELEEYYSYDYEASINKLINDGAEMVLATLGKNGSIFKSKDIKYIETTYTDNIKTTVACGDTYLAAFIGFIQLGYEIDKAFTLGAIAAGLRAKNNEYPTKKDIENFRSK